MLPTWMIEELEKRRREREPRVERPALWVELPEERDLPARRPRPEGGTVVIIDLG